MGNGYSKILQMINLENAQIDNSASNADLTNNKVLPPLTIKRDNHNLSADQINTEENEEVKPIYNDSFKPKM